MEVEETCETVGDTHITITCELGDVLPDGSYRFNQQYSIYRVHILDSTRCGFIMGRSSYCKGMKTGNGDERIPCVFAVRSVGAPALVAKDKECLSCNISRLKHKCETNEGVVVRLLNKIREPHRSTVLARCPPGFQERYGTKTAYFCIGADNAPCGFDKKGKEEHRGEVGRAVQTHGRGSRCIFCDKERLQEECIDPKSRAVLITKLSRCNRKMSEFCIEQRVPEAYRFEFFTKVLYSQEKTKFDNGCADLAFYDAVPVDLLIWWASTMKCENDFFRSMRPVRFRNGTCRAFYSYKRPSFEMDKQTFEQSPNSRMNLTNMCSSTHKPFRKETSAESTLATSSGGASVDAKSCCKWK